MSSQPRQPAQSGGAQSSTAGHPGPDKGRAGNAATRWAAVALYAGLIFFLSHRPSLVDHIPRAYQFAWMDRAGHATEYAILAALVTAAAGSTWKLRGSAWCWMFALVSCSFYGASDELHQAFVPGRSCQLGDWVADTAGAALGAWLHLTRRARMPKATEHSVAFGRTPGYAGSQRS